MISPKAQPVSLEAKSPFVLRVDLGRGCAGNGCSVSACDRRHGLRAFVHYRVDRGWTGCARGRMDDGMPVAVPILSQPRHLENEQRHSGDRDWERKPAAQVPHGLKIMNGGFTISGGEPLMQDRFVVKLFTAAKAMGIHTALDTNGCLGDRLTDEELETIDLVLLDIKAWDPERHRRLTGMDMGPVLNFARRLASRRKPVWLRYVLVPG